MKTLVLVIIGLFTTLTSANEYGGFAQVFVKNGDGTTRLITATILCNKSTESSAKSSLEHELKMGKRYDEEFSSPIYYEISMIPEKGKETFGGTASVKVINTDGKTRFLSASILCGKISICAAKSNLEHELIMNKKYNEEFVDMMTFDIDTCEK